MRTPSDKGVMLATHRVGTQNSSGVWWWGADCQPRRPTPQIALTQSPHPTWAAPSSKPLMTSCLPILNLKGLFLSLEESNFFPFWSIPRKTRIKWKRTVLLSQLRFQISKKEFLFCTNLLFPSFLSVLLPKQETWTLLLSYPTYSLSPSPLYFWDHLFSLFNTHLILLPCLAHFSSSPWQNLNAYMAYRCFKIWLLPALSSPLPALFWSHLSQIPLHFTTIFRLLPHPEAVSPGIFSSG